MFCRCRINQVKVRSGFFEVGAQSGSVQYLFSMNCGLVGLSFKASHLDQPQFLKPGILHAAGDKADVFGMLRPGKDDGELLLEVQSACVFWLAHPSIIRERGFKSEKNSMILFESSLSSFIIFCFRDER